MLHAIFDGCTEERERAGIPYDALAGRYRATTFDMPVMGRLFLCAALACLFFRRYSFV